MTNDENLRSSAVELVAFRIVSQLHFSRLPLPKRYSLDLMAFVISVTGRRGTWQHGSISFISRRLSLLGGSRRKRCVWLTTASATNESDTEQRAIRQRAATGVGKVSSSEQRPSSSSGATPKRLVAIEGSRKFRYVAGNKGPDVWLVVAILSMLLPVLFIVYAFKAGIVDPTGYLR